MPSTLLPGTEVLWFLVFMAMFYLIQLPLRRYWQMSLEGIWLTGFAALAVTFYFRVNINLLLMTGLCLGLLVVAGGLWVVRIRRALHVTRELPLEAVAGTPFTIQYHLTNQSGSWLLGLAVKDRAMRGVLPLPGNETPGFRATAPIAPPTISIEEYDAQRFGDDPFDLHPNQRPVPIFPTLRVFLKPREALTLEQPILFTARGLYRLGPLQALVRDPMGLHALVQLIPSWDVIRILPTWVILEMLPREMLSVHRMDEETTDDREGLSTEFRGIREYRPGDPLKSIHWGLTAKHQQLMVRQYQQLIGEAWGIILDCHEAPELGLGTQSDQERAIALVASLTGVLAAEVRPFVLWVGMDRHLIIDFPGDGLDHQTLLRTLAAVRYDRRTGLDLVLQDARQAYPELPWLLVTTRPEMDVIDALQLVRQTQPTPAVCVVDHSMYAATLAEHDRFASSRAGQLPTPESARAFIDMAEGEHMRVYHLLPETPLARAFVVDE